MNKHWLLHRLPAAAALGAFALLAGCAAVPPPAAARIERLPATAPDSIETSIGIQDIIAMSRKGENAAAIVAKLDKAHTRLRLSAEQIGTMLSQGVAPQVIDQLLDTERRRAFEDCAAAQAQYERRCQERIAQEARQCRVLQSVPPPWPGYPFADCWPPHAGFSHWRCH